MSEENKILNKGLDALLGQNTNNNQKSVKELPVENINPGRFQPRTNFDEEKLLELTNSIKNHGVLSPILVREVGLNKYEVIAGERRLRASKNAGLKTIPTLIDQKQDKDALESALIENLQREDLNAVEEARGYDRLKREFGLTQDEVAASTGKARSTIANSLRLLSLPAKVLDMLSSGKIEKGHAKLLASMDPLEAEKAANNIVKNKLTVKDLAGLSSKKTNKKPQTKTKDRDLLIVEEEMSENFGHKVEIEAKNKKSGKVVINYNTKDELESIISPQEFAGSGPVEGPGSGVSDSIPARLSDGEFVFTAKAVEEIGADNLMAMMKDAEAKADERQPLQEGGIPELREETRPVETPQMTEQVIRVERGPQTEQVGVSGSLLDQVREEENPLYDEMPFKRPPVHGAGYGR